MNRKNPSSIRAVGLDEPSLEYALFKDMIMHRSGYLVQVIRFEQTYTKREIRLRLEYLSKKYVN